MLVFANALWICAAVCFFLGLIDPANIAHIIIWHAWAFGFFVAGLTLAITSFFS